MEPSDDSAKRPRDEEEPNTTRKNKYKYRKKARNNVPEDELFVDWERMMADRWGQVSLLRYISTPEVDTLVGWATHIEGPKKNPASTSNPLAALPSAPLRPSLLEYLNLIAVDVLRADKDKNHLSESFDVSALVTVGMILEELLTATLLPLAEQHVRRCRHLEADNKDAYQEWTLPPEEALVNLLSSSGQQTSGVGLATAGAPTKTAVPGATGTSIFNMASDEQPTGIDSTRTWCRAHSLDMNFVRNNMDLFHVFLPNEKAPTSRTIADDDDDEEEEEQTEEEEQSDEEQPQQQVVQLRDSESDEDDHETEMI